MTRRAVAGLAAALLSAAFAASAPAAPVLEITPAVLDFGPVAAGTIAEASLWFRNPGSAVLLLGGAWVDDSDFAVGGPDGGIPPGTSIAPGDSLAVPLAFRPPALGAYAATLHVSSNDPAGPVRTVSLLGSGAAGAVIQVAPTSFEETLDLGDTVTRELVVRNTGDLALDWALSVQPVTGRRASLAGVRVLWDRTNGQLGTLPWSTFVAELEARGAVVDEVVGTGDLITPALLAAYRVLVSVDVQSGWSAAELAAIAAWVDAGGGVLLIGDNLSSRDRFNFLLNELGAGITMAGTWNGDTVLSGAAIKTHASTAGVARIRVGTAPRELAPVSAPGTPIVVAGGGQTLAAVASVGVGRMAVVADELFDDVTIGEAEGAFNADNRRFGNQIVDWVAGGLWLRPDLGSGVAAPGDSSVVQLLFDAADRRGGAYDVNLHLTSNDAATPAVDVPARLNVIGVAEIDVSPTSFAFADTPVGTVAADSLRVGNPGTEILHVTGVATTSPRFTVPGLPFDVAPGDSTMLPVSFLPDSIGPFSGTLTLTSDAGSTPSLDVPLAGNGIVNCGAACVTPSLRPIDIAGSHGFTFWLDVLLAGNPQPIESVGFDLHFDPDHLVSADSARSTSALTSVQANTIAPGVVRIGGITGPGATVPAGYDGSLLQVLFAVDCPACPPGEESDLYVANFVDDIVGISPCCGTLTLAECPTGHGDVNADEVLSATDALCALRIFVNGGGTPPDTTCDVNGECEPAAADVTCNGVVTPADAQAIFERVLCVAEPTPLPCFGATEPDPCGVPGPRSAASALAWGDVTAGDDGWTVAIRADEAPGAFGLALRLPAGVSFAGLEPGTGGRAWAALEAGTSADGTLRLAGIAGDARGQRGELARLRLRGRGGALRVLDAVDADFAGAWERELPGIPGAVSGITSVRPNPSAGALTVLWATAGGTDGATLAIHDVRGRVVRRLPDASPAAGGSFETRWNGRDGAGHAVAAGIYFVVLRTGEGTFTRKVLLVR